jgi:D-sedoheptulose 7-phosphate isomerase
MPDARITAIFRHTAENIGQIGEGPYADAVARAVDLLQHTLVSDGKLLIFGNGGSSADAQHIAAELVGRFIVHRKPLHAVALGTNTALMTAWSNDDRFDDVFARELEALGRAGDIAWGISTSGNSANVVNALRRAREKGLKTIGLTGQDGGRMAEHCDILMAVPLTATPRIQEVHLVTYHAICAALEDRLFAPDKPVRP